MRTRRIAGLLLLAALWGCGSSVSQEAMNALAPPDDQAMAKDCLAAIRARDFDKVTKVLDPQFVKPGIKSQYEIIAALLDHGEPVSIELVGCNVVTGSGKKRSALTYQYHFADSWVLAEVIIDTVGSAKTVFGIHANPIPASLQELNAFSFSGKSTLHFVFFSLAIATVLFTLGTLVVCVRTKMRRRKWLWIIFVLLGFWTVSFNWSSGQVYFNPLSFSFHLLGVSAARQGFYGPWFLNLSFPLGAIVFLVRRKKLAAAPPPQADGTESAPDKTERV